jgi:long-chain acyl-CoA synthetase
VPASGFSIGGIVRGWGTQTPDAPALTLGDRTVSWGDVYARAQQVAGALAAAGVEADDRIAFLDKNSIEYFEVLYGGALLNAVNVAVNWRLAAPEVAQVVNDAAAKVLVASAEYLPVLDQVVGQLTTVKEVVVIGEDGGPHRTYADWLASAAPQDPQLPVTDDDVALQLYTSGTTGLPKGVMLTNRNFSGLRRMSGQLHFDHSSVNLAAMPLFHIGGSGWALVGMAEGAHTVLLREIVPEAVLETFQRLGVTHAFLVPAVLLFLTLVPGANDYDYSKLRVLTYGASPISEDVLVKCLKQFRCEMFQLYGLTETTGGVVMLAPDDHTDESHRERLRSAGRAMEGVELRIVDTATGEDVPDGQVGEVWIRSLQNMKGYWGKPDETAKSLTADGWFKSGDAGYLVDGYLFLHDRVKDMIVSGGENVYPAEVENALMKHDAVADVAVIGVPSDKWGEEVKAIVVKAEGAEVAPEELIAFAKTQLAGYKVPKTVDFTDALPRNPSGKILKRELREPFWAGRERQIG